MKYATSNGNVIRAVIRSSSAWVSHRYTTDEVDWIAIYEATTSACFYLPAYVWDGRSQLALRLRPTLNGQCKGIRWASDFEALVGDPPGGSGAESRLPLAPTPE